MARGALYRRYEKKGGHLARPTHVLELDLAWKWGLE